VFGNITGPISGAPLPAHQLCTTGGTDRVDTGTAAPDLVPQICGWFSEDGFELSWLSDPGVKVRGRRAPVHRAARPLVAGLRMFSFAEDGRR